MYQQGRVCLPLGTEEGLLVTGQAPGPVLGLPGAPAAAGWLLLLPPVVSDGDQPWLLWLAVVLCFR